MNTLVRNGTIIDQSWMVPGMVSGVICTVALKT